MLMPTLRRSSRSTGGAAAPRPARLSLTAIAGAALLAGTGTQAAGAQTSAVHHPEHPHHHHRTHPAPHRAPVHHVHPAPVPAPVPVPALPAPPPPPPVPANIGTNTKLPLPRFAALRADEVNMRSGPGTRYPILWLYKRRDLPVEITREFDVWRLVEDSDGVRGWVHQATLVGNRTFVVTASGSTDRGPGAVLRDDPQEDAGVVAIVRPGVIGRLRACPAGSAWCRVSVHNYSGWLQRSAFFGLLPNETITPP